MENKGEIIIYRTPEGKVRVDLIYSDETFWLTQKAMAELFGVEVPAISKHLKNIFDSRELNEDSVISKMETTASDGKNNLTSFYSLDAIIAVGLLCKESINSHLYWILHYAQNDFFKIFNLMKFINIIIKWPYLSVK